MEDSLGARIKKYESAYNYKLTPRSCLFLRLDGKSFHTFTRGMVRPFDITLSQAMIESALATAKEMQGFKLAYIQSDECTFMLTDFDTFQTQGWFGYELNKVVSISASIFTANFNKILNKGMAFFDSRAFIVPLEDAPNVFIWRQTHWVRNSVSMLAQSHFSHKELHKKNQSSMHEMLFLKNINWADLDPIWKNGTFINNNFDISHDKKNYSDLKIELELMFEANKTKCLPDDVVHKLNP